MAKAGGRGKGRPRKLEISVNQATPKPVIEVGESSKQKEIASSTTPEAGDSLRQIELEFIASSAKQAGSQEKEVEKEEKQLKVEDTTQVPMRKRGKSLSYVAPQLKQGIPTAKLQVTEIEKDALKWKTSIIFYVIGENPTISYLTSYLHNHCGIEGTAEIFYHAEGYYVIRFEKSSDKEKLLYEGPYMLASRPVIVKEWCPDFCFENEVLKEVPLWVWLPRLPLTCWSEDSLSQIGSVIGKPICADEYTSQQQRISYARMLVEVDITKPLIYKIPIEGENGLMFEQQVYYEWVPMFCQKCHVVGHICREKLPKTEQKQQ